MNFAPPNHDWSGSIFAINLKLNTQLISSN